MERISKKRQEAAKRGDLKLGYNSTFKRVKIHSKDQKQMKEKRPRTKMRKASRTELARAKARCWKACSLFIRLRDANEFGIVKCCTCTVEKHWKQMNAGHFAGRAHAATFVDERNLNAQCPGCNLFKAGKPVEHAAYIDAKYGPGTSMELYRLARTTKKWSVAEYDEQTLVFKAKIKVLIAECPSKMEGGPVTTTYGTFDAADLENFLDVELQEI